MEPLKVDLGPSYVLCPHSSREESCSACAELEDLHATSEVLGSQAEEMQTLVVTNRRLAIQLEEARLKMQDLRDKTVAALKRSSERVLELRKSEEAMQRSRDEQRIRAEELEVRVRMLQQQVYEANGYKETLRLLTEDRDMWKAKAVAQDKPGEDEIFGGRGSVPPGEG